MEKPLPDINLVGAYIEFKNNLVRWNLSSI